MYRDTNPDLVPVHTSIIGLCCSSCWFVYGLLKPEGMDWNVIVPNLLGIIFSVVTIISWLIVNSRKKSQQASLVFTDETGSDLLKTKNKDKVEEKEV